MGANAAAEATMVVKTAAVFMVLEGTQVEPKMLWYLKQTSFDNAEA